MTHDLETTQYGMTFLGDSFLFEFSLTGLAIEMKLYYPSGNLAETFTLSNVLQIDPEEDKRLIIKQHDVWIGPNTYKYELIMNPEGVRLTWIDGTWKITKNV